MLRAIFATLAISSLITFPALAEKVIVKPGETLSEIADKYKVSISELKHINRIIDPKKLQAGDAISLPINTLSREEYKSDLYIVKEGESLSLIAKRFGASEEDIIHLNNIQNSNHIKTGQRIKLPARKKLSTAGFKTAHVVSPGETLNTIGEKYMNMVILKGRQTRLFFEKKSILFI